MGRSTMVSANPIASKVAAAAALAKQTPSVSLGVSVVKPRGVPGRVWAVLALDVAMLAAAATLVTLALHDDDAGRPEAPAPAVAVVPTTTIAGVTGSSGDVAAAHNAASKSVARNVVPTVGGVAVDVSADVSLDGGTPAVATPAPGPELIDPTAVVPATSGAVDAAVASLDAAVAPMDAEPDDPRASAQADEIGLLSRRSQKRFDRCYTLASKGLPADQPLSGQVAVAFQIMPSGQVNAVTVDHDTTGSAQLGRCLVSEIGSWHFAASDATAPASFVRTFRFDAPK